MWFLAALVVVVMGGVVALAAGHGAPMADAYDDRPDSLVPGDRPLEGEDVRRVRFSLAFRGYRMSEVDALLDRLSRQLDRDDRPSTPAPFPGDPARADEDADTPPAPEARGGDPAT